MATLDIFKSEIKEKYSFEGDSIMIGGAMYDGECQTEHFVRIPLKTLNRHGLIAGATGTGKTKTLQILAEQFSAHGIPSIVMDIKGDLSGLAVKSEGHPKIDERHAAIGYPFLADNSPIEFLTLSDEPGARLRATVSEFGPILFSKILGLNENQEGVMAVVFQYCDNKGLPLLDLKDIRKTLQYLSKHGKEEIEEEYGRLSTASVGAIMRRIVELEQQGADVFFGERSFDVEDLLTLDEKGKGVISILRLGDLQGKPKLFSAFMLQLLAEIYTTFPEEGDMDQPKLAIFIDEAHLVFDSASRALQDQIETIVKLIRSKGVAIFFITQNPTDIPNDILSQLGLKIQHALRAFTARDRKAIKLVSQNYPETEYYDVEELLTQLGIGEALLTVLDEDGIPTPLVHTYLRAPQSRMDILSHAEIEKVLFHSELVDKYNQDIDRESAYEILSRKIDIAKEKEHQEEIQKQYEKGRGRRSRREKSTFEEILGSTTGRQIGRTVARELTRGVLGMLGIKTRRRRSYRRRKKGWF